MKPYQPPGVWEPVAFSGSNTGKYTQDPLENLHRRSVYTFWKRTAIHPAFSAFNAPNREDCSVVRERTNTPLQALVLLNDVQHVEAARVLAETLLKNSPQKDDAARMDEAFLRVVGHPAEVADRTDLAALLEMARNQYGSDLAKAKRVIYLFMSGAPSQLDTFDYKPGLREKFDVDLPDSIRGNQRLTAMTASQARFPIAPSVFDFKQYGNCGRWVSDLLPKTGSMADDITCVHSMWTEAINHDPAITYIQTGNQIPGRPSMGSWISYGLGSLNRNLPDFVVLNCEPRGQALYERLWGSGFLPSKHSGVAFRSQGDPVLYLSNPDGIDSTLRRSMLDKLSNMNQRIHAEIGDPETEARIAQYEMAFRMQSSVPELADISGEPQHILDMYGPDATKPGTFGYNCLMARRMAERDVRFVQIFHRGWDQHRNLPKDIARQTKEVDQPAWALVQDLKQRGLLEGTLVIWGGEFGRTVYSQGTLTKENHGRDHHPRCFTTWLAGGGIKPGRTYGETDEFSYNVVKDPVHIRDLNATVLHQLGIDHMRLSVKHMGLDQRLTGVDPARVVKEILA